MAKKTKKLSITRRTLGRLMKLIPAKRRKNIEMGFYDSSGFHPIHASKDYIPERHGEGYRRGGGLARSKRAKSARRKRAFLYRD